MTDFRVDKSKPLDEDMPSHHYDFHGKKIVGEQLTNAVAKTCGEKHWIKFNHKHGYIFNPFSMNASELSAFSNNIIKPNFSYVLVRKELFELYLSFLKDGNMANYVIINREIKNG